MIYRIRGPGVRENGRDTPSRELCAYPPGAICHRVPTGDKTGDKMKQPLGGWQKENS